MPSNSNNLKKIHLLKKKNKLKNNSKNKTIKKNVKLIKAVPILTPEQREIVCKTSANTFDTFEDKVEELFKKKKINILSASYNLEKQIIDDLKKAVSPSDVKPNEDYYSYINDRWLSEIEITEEQKYIVQVDDFRLIQHKVYVELIKIIEDFISNPSTKNSKQAKCIKTAYTSFIKYNTIKQTRETAKRVISLIEVFLQDDSGVWQMLALMNSSEIISWGAPFVWSLNPDDKNPKIYKCYLEPPQFSLIDTDVYFDDETDKPEDKKYKTEYRRRFFKYLHTMFNIALGDNHGYNIKDVFDTEVEIINAFICDKIKLKNDEHYNLITKAEAMNDFGFNWTDFCKHLGFKNIPHDFVTSNVNYLLCGTKLLKEKWNTPQWKTYWIYLYIRQQCRWNEEGSHNYFDFEGDFVRGQEKEVDQSIKAIFPMGFLFNTFLTNQYIEKYNNPQAINYVKTMAEDLKTVFIRIIRRNGWMQKKTKEEALKKLHNFKLTVGSPELLREDPLLDYKIDEPWENLFKMSRWRLQTAIDLVDKPLIDIPVMDWSQIPPKFIGTQAYVVNASYTPSKNGIYIPLGYIQKPFVDLDERGLEYNLSRIGFTIAHEMSHSLDDWGSKYDENGALHDWWTEKDKKAFKKIQEDIIKQYEVFASYDDIDLDAVPTIGESLADISGLAICQEYLRDFQLKNKDILPIQSISFEAFFIYFAVQSRQKISKKAILAQLKTNPHPLDKYRCNVPLSRTNVFRAIYKVKKGDKMWWPSTNTVWSN
jgi:endothelin-converting enzyme/putative endopeptidase